MDANICENCSLYLPTWKKVCPNCHQSIVLDSASRISIWRLGDIRDGVVGHIARNLRAAFGMNVVIQPGYLDPRPSSRPRWRGLSANVFLRQVYRRHLRGTAVSIGMTESNIVPDQNHNFLFGYAYLSLPSAVISLHQMSVDHPSLERLAARASAIAVHEIGHTFGLDHHAYDSGVDCVMVGDEEVDSLEAIDAGTIRFCRGCRLELQKSPLARKTRHRPHKPTSGG